MKRSLCAVLAALLLCLSGCSASGVTAGGKDVEKLLLIRSLGVDASSGTEVTACTGVGLNGTAPELLRRKGLSAAQAVESLAYNAAGKEPFFSHTEHILLGEEEAAEAFGACVDWMLRSMEIRLDASLYIVRGGTAGALMEAAMGESTAVSDMLSLLQRSAVVSGYGAVTGFGEILAALEGRGVALVTAVAASETDDLSQSAGEAGVVPAGFAVIREGTLAGFTDPAQSYVVSLLTNRLESCPLPVEGATLSIIQGDTKIRPGFSPDGNIQEVEIAVTARCNVTQLERDDNLLDPEVRAGLERAAQEKLTADITALLSRSQELDADILDLSGACARTAPAAFARMPERFADRYAQLPLRVSVAAELVRTYDVDEPTNLRGEERG